MIKSFSHKGLEVFFKKGSKRGIQPKHAERLETVLDHLSAAADIKDMNFPGSNLHKLNPKTPDAEKQVWSLTVSGNWRITFKFFNGDAYEVDYLDYH